MLERNEAGRYRARCKCLRSSPILDGPEETVEALLADLDWKKTAADVWRCPVCWGRARTEPPRPTEPRKRTPRTVLLVEDDLDARTIYGTTLRYVGYRVIEAPTVSDAKKAVRAFLFDAVVLDCRLPDGDGLDLLNVWRDTIMGRVPVVVVTAHKEHHEVEAAQMVGADAFVPKPCPGDVLAAHVDRIIRAGGPTRRLRAPVRP